MNSRERLLKALECGIPDRVPVSTYELCGHNSANFENSDPSYESLMDYIREKTDAITMWNPVSNETFWHSSAKVDKKTDKKKNADGSETTRETIKTKKGPLTRVTKRMPGVHTPWRTEHWCKTPDDIKKMLEIPFEPLSYAIEDYGRICFEAEEHGIIMSSVPDAFRLAIELFEFGEATVWALTETEQFEEVIEVMHERVMENLAQLMDETPVDLYRITGPEYATPPYLPPNFFEKYVLPFDKEMVDFIHEQGKKVRIHSHGKIGSVLDYILATGADGLDPCEPPPDGDITLAALKKKTTGKMCLFGNLEVKILEAGSTDDVKKAVRTAMDEAKAGGGFIIMPTAAPINTPLSKKTEENYRVFIDTALETGKY
ncbi:MAG: uroporphyrinogen decarboxylase family protein [Fibrobacterota bacterium]